MQWMYGLASHTSRINLYYKIILIYLYNLYIQLAIEWLFVKENGEHNEENENKKGDWHEAPVF